MRRRGHRSAAVSGAVLVVLAALGIPAGPAVGATSRATCLNGPKGSYRYTITARAADSFSPVDRKKAYNPSTSPVRLTLRSTTTGTRGVVTSITTTSLAKTVITSAVRAKIDKNVATTRSTTLAKTVTYETPGKRYLVGDHGIWRRVVTGTLRQYSSDGCRITHTWSNVTAKVPYTEGWNVFVSAT